MADLTKNPETPSYPVVSFNSALEIARAVSEAGGARSGVQKAVIASHVGSSDTSGAFLQRLSTARSYQMIEGRGTYRLTPAGVSYFYPSNQGDAKRALLSFLSAPSVFAEIIKRFDGTRIPSTEMLANVLHREVGISESWKDRVAGFFTRAAHAAGVVDSQGFLRYRAALQTMESQPQSESSVPVGQPDRQQTTPVPTRMASEGMNTLVFTVGDQSVRLETSQGELSHALWEKLNVFVQALDPNKK